jgi:hypothetical protein
VANETVRCGCHGEHGVDCDIRCVDDHIDRVDCRLPAGVAAIRELEHDAHACYNAAAAGANMESATRWLHRMLAFQEALRALGCEGENDG